VQGVMGHQSLCVDLRSIDEYGTCSQ